MRRCNFGSNLAVLAACAAVAHGPLASGQGAPLSSRLVVLDERTQTLTAFREDSLALAGRPGPDRCKLRPLVLVSRDGADLLDATLPQQSDALGTAAIALPDGGWLLRYRDPQNLTAGILWVSAGGRCRVLFEQPLRNGFERLLPHIAVSHLEPRAAVIEDENLTGRGDVWLLRFDGQDFAATGSPAVCVTSTLNSPDAEPHSLVFAAGALFFADEDRLLRRAPSDGSAQAVALPLPKSGGLAPAEISNEIAVSRDGSTLAFQAGASEASWDLYVASAAGVVTNLSKAPSEYNVAGHTTSEPTGPRMALSDDGATLIYADDVPDLELFSRPTDGSAAPVPFTTDVEFEHSLADGSTVVALFGGPLFSFGEAGFHRDFYRATIAGGAASVTNLTGTSGAFAAPFPKGALLQPTVAARTSGSGVVMVDLLGLGTGTPRYDVWTIDAAGSAPLLGGLLAAPRLVRGGTAAHPVLLATVTTSGGDQLWKLPESPSGGATLLLDAPGLSLRGVTLRADGREAALIVSAGAGLEQVVAMDLASGRLRLLTPQPGFAGAATAWSPSGRVLFTYSPTSATHLSAWAEAPAGSGIARRLPRTGGAPRFLVR